MRSSIGRVAQPLSETTLCLTLESFRSVIFLPLLQQGFMVEVDPGCTLKAMLCTEFGIRPKYLADRVETILLDGRPVDHPEAAILRDGSRVALSAAMPGLAGATMRRRGILAPLRSSIAYREQKEDSPSGRGRVVVRLFNLLIDELGPIFLEHGVWIRGEILKSVVNKGNSELCRMCKEAKVNGTELALEELFATAWAKDNALVLLRVGCRN